MVCAQLALEKQIFRVKDYGLHFIIMQSRLGYLIGLKKLTYTQQTHHTQLPLWLRYKQFSFCGPLLHFPSFSCCPSYHDFDK